MVIGLGGKVFAQKSYTSILRSDIHYYSSSALAKDIKAGKLKLSSNVNELFWINRVLDRWNIALRDGQVFKKGDTEIFQLSSGFTNLQDARNYIADILSNHCKDFDATFKKGEYKIGRAEEGRMNAITVDLERDARAGEKITMLVPSSFGNEVSKSDGDYPLIDTFSLYCLNDIEKVKFKKPDPAQPLVAVKQQETVSVLSPSYEMTYRPMLDSYGSTYNTYNTVNNPPAPPVDKHPNRAIWIGVGANVLTTMVNFAMNLFMMRRLQRQTMPYQAPQIYPYQYQQVQTPVANPGSIQGNTGSVDYTPIQGSTTGTVLYTPIQGGTTLQQIYDPVQGWIWK